MFSQVLIMSSRFRRRVVRPVVWMLVTALAAGTLSGVAAPAEAAPGRQRPPVQDLSDPVRGADGTVKPRRANPVAASRITAPAAVSWPTPGSTVVAVGGGVASGLSVSARAAAAAPARVGGMPVGVRQVHAADAGQRSADLVPSKVRVDALSRDVSDTADVDGPVVALRRADAGRSAGRVSITLGYAGFAEAYGGDFGSRLKLVRLPECALTTPGAAGCAPTPVPSTNDTAADQVTSVVDAAATGRTLFALTAGEASSQGSYAATKLAPSSKWSVAPSSGAFNWTYPLRLPPVPGGQGPEVSLSYSSQSVDGRTAATNNQGSWIGEGFGYEPGYIERRYKPCNDDGHDTSADLCWSHDNATIVLGDSSGELIKDASGRWRLTSDADWKIEQLTGATNGDNNGEHWKVTTPDGVEHYFGLNRLFGWATGKEETNSTWSVPVFGDDSGEPCYNATFLNASCMQAWRWNLDYVRDTHDNVASYFYQRESNWYALGAKTDVNGAEYHRGGWLERIDYGQRHNAVYTTNAPARVRFTTAERCLPSGAVDCDAGDLNQTTAPYWPDVPYDRICAQGTRCKLDQAAPSFFTRKRLTTITTEIRSGTSWSPVDSWQLDHWFTDNADGSKTLWLNSIQRTGHVGGTAISLPPVTLIGEQLPNRIVVAGDNIAPLIRFRVNTIYTDSGAQIDVNYEQPNCAAGDLPTDGSSTRRCYAVKWNPSNGDPKIDWFHKYVVKEVIETDRTGGQPDMMTRYEYLGNAAWRKAEPDGFTKPEYLTWSQWRGYQTVRVTRGDGQFMTTRTEHTFLRGMNGNPLPGGGTQSVTVLDSAGTAHTDTDELAGWELETVTYNGSAQVAKTITSPWLYETGKQTFDWGSSRSTYLRPGTERSFTSLAAGGWRETRTVNTYDTTHGRMARGEDLGDVATAADDRCTRTTYADNADKWMYSFASRVETVSVRCDSTPNRATQVISDVRTFFDSGAFGAAPTKGDPTKTERLASHDGTTATYVTQAETTFDAYGRPRTSKDAAGSTTTTAYFETDGLTVRKEETGPISTAWKTSTYYAPAWGVPTAQVDMNTKRGDLEYDALGRLVKVWLPDRPRTSSTPPPSPSMKYTYLQRTDKPVAVKTEKLNIDGSYFVEYELFDGYLRPRQKQVEGPDNGRLVTDTFYTGTGQIAKTYDTYHAAGAPTDTLFNATSGDVQAQTFLEYDGADRVRAEVFRVAGDELWRTTTTYGGDRVNVDPPEGGVPTTTITDARGQTVALRQYKGAGPSGAYDETTYTYTAAGQLATLTDPANNRWEWTYDQRGRKSTSKDPDAGLITYTYDDLDRMSTSTDARGQLLTYTYDKLGRKTAIYAGTVATGTKLAQWTWDAIAKGQLYSAFRYIDGQPYGVSYPTLDSLYRVQRTRYHIPSVAGMEKLAGTYEFTTAYNRDGTVQSLGMPAAGGLPAEAVVFGYDAWRRPVTMTGASTYVVDTEYAQTGELMQLELSTGGKKAWLTFEYEKGTKRLHSSRLDRQDAPVIDIHAQYTYDAAGNVKTIADTPAGGQRDIQCFSYDYLRRMTEAWSNTSTAADPCAGGPATTGVGGPAAYHHSYAYDVTGGRTSETVHGVGGAPDVTRDYTYPAPGQAKPHSLSTVTEHTAAGDRLYSYAYDESGNMTERNQVGVEQILDWDAEGHLASVTQGAQQTSFVYDADGERLLRKEPDATTLYLPGMELKLNHASQTVDGTRFYSFAGQTVAVREVTGVKFLASDHEGTQSAVVDATTGAIVRRRMTPFGATRGADPGGWPADKGFVGGTQDPTTGLTHLGAREYDPTIGRFISVDPVFVADDPSQHNAYQYGRNNPVTFSDPTGLRMPDEDLKLLKSGGGGSGSGAGTSGSGGGCYGGNQSAGCGSPPGPYAAPPPNVDGGGGGNGDEARRLREARQAAERAKQKLIDAAKALTKIAMDELGVTAALDCFTSGDLGSCGEVAIDVATTLVGGMVAKLARKYGAPWKWKKAAGLAKKVWNGLDDLIGGVRDWFKNTKLVKSLAKDCNSFMPGTAVLLADGSTKPIEEIDVGDVVLATDPETGKTKPKKVVATIIGRGDKDLVQVSVDTDRDSGGDSMVVATAGHPFWVASLGLWLDASDLTPGQMLRTAAGTWVQITALQRWTQQATVHNLTIADTHTYYVVAGHRPVLVHNCDGLTDTPDLVPDDAIVVRGGASDMPGSGEVFSGSYGQTLDEAAAGVPHGQIRATTAGVIRRGGGRVEYAPEPTRGGNMNNQHVNVCMGQGSCPFGDPQPNPVPKADRIK